MSAVWRDCDPLLHARCTASTLQGDICSPLGLGSVTVPSPKSSEVHNSKTKVQIAWDFDFHRFSSNVKIYCRYIIYHKVNRSCVCAFCILAILPSCGAVVVAGERSCCDPTIVNYLTNDDCVYNVYIPQSTGRMWNSTITW